MQPNNWRKMIVPMGVAVVVTGFLLYILIRAMGPACLRFLAALAGVLPPFIIAIALALLLDPVVAFLRSRGLSRLWGTLVIFLVGGIVLSVVIALVAPKIVSEVNELVLDAPEYYERISEFVAQSMVTLRPVLSRLDLPTTPSEVAERFSSEIRYAAGAAGGFIITGLQQIVSKSVWLMLIILLTFMLLLDMETIRSRMILLVPEAHRDRVVSTGSAVGNVFLRYLRGLVILCVLYGIASAILYSLLGIRYALLISLAAGVLYAIPYLGALLTTLIVVIVALLQRPDAIYLAVLAGGLSVALNQVFDMVLTPRVAGGAVGLHPVISIFALMFAGAAFGIVGMLLAVPVAGSLQLVLLELFPKLRKPEPPPRPKKRRQRAPESPPAETLDQPSD